MFSASAKIAGVGFRLDGLVVVDPVLHVRDGEIGLAFTNAAHDARNAGVDNHAAAHGAGPPFETAFTKTS